MERFVFLLAVSFACALGAFVVAGLLCKVGEKLRSLRRAGWTFIIAAIIATIHGGAKNILARFSADEGITVTSAEFTRATNDVEQTFLVYSYAGADASWPLWVRDFVSNEWEHLEFEWMYDDRFFVDGTNTVTWWVDAPASNFFPHAMYWIGNNPPPVEIVSFVMSAQGVAITYAVDGSVLHGKTGALTVETSQGNGPWGVVHEESVTETVTNTFTQGGFFVDRLTRWRVRMEVEK